MIKTIQYDIKNNIFCHNCNSWVKEDNYSHLLESCQECLEWQELRQAYTITQIKEMILQLKAFIRSSNDILNIGV